MCSSGACLSSYLLINHWIDQPDRLSGLSVASIVLLCVSLAALADVHPLQLGHVPQVSPLQLLQLPVVLPVGEMNLLLPLQAVDFQRQRAANTSSTFSVLAALRVQIKFLKGWWRKTVT